MVYRVRLAAEDRDNESGGIYWRTVELPFLPWVGLDLLLDGRDCGLWSHVRIKDLIWFSGEGFEYFECGCILPEMGDCGWDILLKYGWTL
jgi:hypothetical protein